MNDILSLRSEVKQLQMVAQQLEPFVKTFAIGVSAGEMSSAASDAAGHQHLQALLEHLSRLQLQEQTPQSQQQTTAPSKDCRHPRGTAASNGILYYIIYPLCYVTLYWARTTLKPSIRVLMLMQYIDLREKSRPKQIVNV